MCFLGARQICGAHGNSEVAAENAFFAVGTFRPFFPGERPTARKDARRGYHKFVAPVFSVFWPNGQTLRRRNMNRRFSSKVSKTDWARIKVMKDAEIKLTPEHPEANVRHIVRRGLKPAAPKTSISLRVDADVLEWFKRKGPRYQTRMNAVLRAFKDASVWPMKLSCKF